MNRNIIYTLWMTAALLLTACTQEDFPISDAGDAVPLTISVTDGGFGSESRAAEDSYRTEFTAGDECGLYIVRGGTVIYDNVKLIATVGTDGSLTWQPETGETLAGGLTGEKYFLYYPYQSVMSGKTDASATEAEGFFAPLANGWQPAADQSTYTAYTASDLMTAQGNAAQAADGSLRLFFSMSHRMALAVIEMPKTVYKFTDNTDGAIPDYTVASSVDFTDSSLQPYGIAPGTYRCIVNPAQPISFVGSYDNTLKEFTINNSGIGDGSYKTYKIDGAPLSEIQTTLQMGDYFCKNSDNKWYIIPQEATPDANVIGIVFYVGQHETDNADYSESGIRQSKCHGYVVALTDVNNEHKDRLCWEFGPNREYDKSVGTTTSDEDWQGYSNSLKFHEFVNKNENKDADWEMKHFPAAFSCETYGKRTLDQNGNDANELYDWQHPLAAPSNTSGWILPSCGQLQYLYRKRSFLSDRMTHIKDNTPGDCNYRDKIKWFITNVYWSASESSDATGIAWGVDFSDGSIDYRYSKTNDFYVRAVLAF